MNDIYEFLWIYNNDGFLGFGIRNVNVAIMCNSAPLKLLKGLHAGLEELLAHIILQIGALNGWQ